MQSNQLSPTHKRKSSKRIGRGRTRGKTSGRGIKGQKAHGGHGLRPEERDIIKRLPKLRGHGKNRGRTVNSSKERSQVLTLTRIDALYANGETVSPQTLVARGAAKRFQNSLPQVKVVATGSLTKKLTFERCQVSAGARKAIEEAGGTIG